MTKSLRLSLLGDVSIQLGENPISGLPSRAAEALLIYLVCSERPVGREKLAELLWADRTQTQAMTNLRTILTPLRRALGDHLIITRQTLAFDHQSDYWLDAAEFKNQLKALDPQEQRAIDEKLARQLQSILDLYQGDFLEGFYIREGRGFEEWAALQRERLRLLAREGFRFLAHYQLEAGHYNEGIQTAIRWQGFDPYDEDACRTRMWLLTRAGQRNSALQCYQDFVQLLSTELGVTPVSTTKALFRRLQVISFPPSLNLPTTTSSFVGRTAEIVELEGRISSPETRLLTILGSGGIGKTRLAIEVGRSLAERKPGRFLDGISFVPLAAVDTPDALPTRIAEAIELPLQGSESPQKELLEHLREREILLILDNFEHLIDENGAAIALLVEIVHHAPQTKILITSRERLNLYEEMVFELPGLDVPLPDAVTPERSSAVTLFLQNARKTQGQFSPSTDEVACIAQACRLVQGVPLAIELAASWMHHYTCTEIVEQIENSLDFLSSPYRNIPARHRSLRAVFEHSWNLLTPTEQDVFALFSIFRGGFRVEAAEAVLVNQPSDLVIFALVEKSLVQQQPEGRYDIHPLLREYAHEKLLQQSEAHAQAAERQAGFYINFLRSQHSGESPEQRAAIRLEINNIQAAWIWAAQQQDLALLERGAATLHNFYSAQSWFHEGIEIFQFALDRLDEKTAKKSPKKASILCDLLGRKARMCIHIGQLETARADLQAALTYLEQVEDPERRSIVLSYLAITNFYAGEYHQAVELASESRLLAKKSGDQDGIAFALNFTGSCYKALGNYDQTGDSFKDALEMYRSLEDDIGAAMVLHNLGNLAQANDDYEVAKNYYQECSEIFKANDHLHSAAATLTNAGKLAMRQEDYKEALRMLSEGLEMKRQIGDQRGMAVALIALGDVFVTLGDHPQAQENLNQGLTLALEVGDINLILDGLAVIADWLLKQEQFKVAGRLLDYILRQQATSQETRERVVKIKAEAKSKLTPSLTGSPLWLNDDPLEEVAAKLLSEYIHL